MSNDESSSADRDAASQAILSVATGDREYLNITPGWYVNY